MIIAGFSGVRKTHFCQKNRNAIDFISMPFKYINFYQLLESLGEGEDIKAHEDLDFLVAWEEYYHYALLETYRKYPEQIIVIPSTGEVLKRLVREHIPVTLVYPAEEAKEEYKNRYKNRGNSDAFLKVFIDRWDEWMKALRNLDTETAIELKAGECLSDVIGPVPYK